MKILVRQEDYSAGRYELQVGDSALEFISGDGPFYIPYGDVKDFCITQDGRGKSYFTMLCAGKMYEGQIPDPREGEPFTAALKAKLRGVIHIEVRKS